MYIAETNSTNTLLRERLAQGSWLASERWLRAGFQTAGRGQTGNGWESEAGKNLLFSVLLDPTENLFDLNILVSAAVHKMLNGQLSTLQSQLSIKWPNDIYWQDRKIAGILIENALIGSRVCYTIGGVGVNINQTEFVSGAPNPVSLKQITGRDYDLEELMTLFMNALDEVQSWGRDEQWAYYRAHLYRREGYYPFVEREVNGTPTMNADASAQGQFLARIQDILPSGEIVLQTPNGQERKYHFKQIRYVL